MAKLKKILALLPMVFLLTGCNMNDLEIPDVMKLLVPNLASFLVQLFALIVLIIIVIFVAYKPVKKMLKKRGDYIEENIKESEKSRAISAQNVTQSEEMILASKKKANEIVESANINAKKQSEAMLEETRNEIAKMKDDAEKDIIRSKEEALEAIRTEMVDVAMTASSEILKREVSNEDNKRLAKEFIENL